MSIIFLDIDGVLATEKQYYQNKSKFQHRNKWAKELGVPYSFDKKCVDIFNEILSITDAEIILSSDWRLKFDLIQLDTIFKGNGIIKSPRMFTKVEPKSFGNISENRAWEIELCVNDLNLKNYVIIDDLSLSNYLKNSDKFVQTIDNEGIKQIGIKDKILKILNNG
jgi:hypothetical protein